MTLLQKISIRVGLTENELKVITFLLIILIIGIILKFFGWNNETSLDASFDYTEFDSIFYASNYSLLEKKNDKEFDYKQESSDFNTTNFVTNQKKQELREKSIDLNTASIEQLIMLPGIGVKTAESILAFRKANGGFNTLEELLEVKGIGISKLERIKKYIFVR